MKKIAAIALLSLSLSVPAANAQQLEKTYTDWSVFALQNKGEKMCYIATTPIKKSGTYKKRGEPYLLVTHRSKTVDEVSVSAGFPFDKGSKVKLTVDKKDEFNLFTSVEVPEVAWARNSAEDQKIVNTLKKGIDLTVDATSQKDSTSKDTYSLRGFTRAYKHMKTICK